MPFPTTWSTASATSLSNQRTFNTNFDKSNPPALDPMLFSMQFTIIPERRRGGTIGLFRDLVIPGSIDDRVLTVLIVDRVRESLGFCGMMGAVL